jgi:hypothetical protein
MKIILGRQHHWTWLWLLILVCHLPPNRVWAADRLGIPLVEATDLAQRPSLFVGRRIGVFGLLSCLDHLHCALGSPTSKSRVIRIGTQRMRKEDKQRLARQCSQTRCPIILVGTLTRDTFAATAVYDSGLPVPSPKPSEIMLAIQMHRPIPEIHYINRQYNNNS